MTDIVIRPRRPGDLPELARVLVRVHARDGYPVEGVASPDAWLTPAGELAAWTAVLENRPVGHVALAQAGPNDDAAVLWQEATGGDLDHLALPVRLFVDPDQRRRGAGRLLMNAAATYARGHGLALAFDVMLKDRDAIGLYEALGCHRLGAVKHQHSDGRVEPAAVYVAPSDH